MPKTKKKPSVQMKSWIVKLTTKGEAEVCVEATDEDEATRKAEKGEWSDFSETAMSDWEVDDVRENV